MGTKKTPPITDKQFVQDVQNAVGGSIAGAATGTSAGGASVPGVSSADAGDVITFTLPGQAPAFTPTVGLATKDTAGGTQTTFQNWMESIRSLSAPARQVELKDLQSQLKATGLIKDNAYVPTGVLDSTTLTAWKDFGLSLVGAPPGVSATTMLNYGKDFPLALAQLKADQQAINSARDKAAQVTNSNVTLTDPNKVAQTFATAMESMGMGTPTQAQTDQFVQAFINGPQGEVAATQNEVAASKQNYLSSYQSLNTAVTDVNQGHLTAGEQAAALTGPGGLDIGPTTIATKAQPNLDAEAIASAKSVDPAMYLASQSTNLYGLIQRMLGGNLDVATSSQSPTSQTPSGGVITAPITGAP